MSTQQITPRQPQTRVGAAFVALGALVAIGLSVLILALTGAHRTPEPQPGDHRRGAAIPGACPSPRRSARPHTPPQPGRRALPDRARCGPPRHQAVKPGEDQRGARDRAPRRSHRTHVSCRWPRTRQSSSSPSPSPDPHRHLVPTAPQALSRHGSRAPTSREGHADRNGVPKTTNHRNHRARTRPRRPSGSRPARPITLCTDLSHDSRLSEHNHQSSRPPQPHTIERMPPSDADGFVATIRRGLRTAGVLVRAGEPGSEPCDAVSEQVHARRVA